MIYARRVEEKNRVIDSKMKALGYVKEYDNILGDPYLNIHAIYYWRSYSEKEVNGWFPDIDINAYRLTKRIEILFFKDRVEICSYIRNYGVGESFKETPGPLTEEEIKLVLQKIKCTKKWLKKYFA